MTWSVRARLTAWYGAVMVAVLVTAAIAVTEAQARFGLSRLDAEMAQTQSTIEAIVRHEFTEGFDLAGAAKEASTEVRAPGTTMVLGHPGAGDRIMWGDPAPPEWAPDLDALAAHGPQSITLDGRGYRVNARVASAGDRSFVIAVLTTMHAFEAQRSELQRALWVGVLVAIAGAIIGGLLVARQALRPLTTMARQATAITERDPSHRLNVPASGDELSRLAVAFNALLDRLSAALLTQRQFMADASHQMRTPVSVLQTTAQVLLGREGRAESEYRESMTIVAEQSARLARLVNVMFLFARGDSGARLRRSEALYLDELLAECVRAVAVLATPRGITVSAAGDTDVPFTGDDELLRDMIVNLLENAVRYSPRGGRVIVELHGSAAGLRLRVRDEGPGIPLADRERIFERFVRLDQRSDGAGLGLPMARWIAEAHGGTLTLESSGPGGSCFAVTFPPSPAAAD